MDVQHALSCIDISDEDQFARYAFRILSESPSKFQAHGMTREERHGDDRRRGDTHRDAYEFLYKAFALVGVLDNRGFVSQTLRALVLLKTLYHDRNDRFAFLSLIEPHRAVDAAIRCYVDDDVIPDESRRGCEEKENPKDHGRHDCSVYVNGFWFRSPPAFIEQKLKFWNFASAAHVLRHACLAGECNSRRGICIHNHCFSLLDWLQKKAWSEIRGIIFRTLGTLFSTELTEKIFECALQAEGLPLDPRVRQAVVTAEVDVQAQPRVVWRVKDEYRWRFTQDRDPSPLRFIQHGVY